MITTQDQITLIPAGLYRFLVILSVLMSLLYGNTNVGPFPFDPVRIGDNDPANDIVDRSALQATEQTICSFEAGGGRD